MVDGIVAGSLINIIFFSCIILFFRRTVNKILDHIDDQNIHIKEGNGYITQDELNYKLDGVKENINEIKEHMQKLYNLYQIMLKEQRDNNIMLMEKFVKIIEK